MDRALPPDATEFAAVAEQFDLHELAVEDAVKAHQRPKLERYGDMLFLVSAPGPVHRRDRRPSSSVRSMCSPARDFVITVRHSEAPDLARFATASRSVRISCDADRRRSLHAIIDRVVDDYGPVVAGSQNDIDEIENDVFDGSPTVSRRIYELAREVIEFHRATKPLDPMLKGLMDAPGVADEERAPHSRRRGPRVADRGAGRPASASCCRTSSA